MEKTVQMSLYEYMGLTKEIDELKEKLNKKIEMENKRKYTIRVVHNAFSDLTSFKTDSIAVKELVETINELNSRCSKLHNENYVLEQKLARKRWFR